MNPTKTIQLRASPHVPNEKPGKSFDFSGFSILGGFCGAYRDRTGDLMTASHALSQLS